MDIDVDRSPSQQGLSASGAASPGVFDGDGPDAAFTAKSGLTRKGKRVAKGKTGTRVRFWPDRQIFTKDADLRVRGAARPGPADVVHRPGPRAGDPRPARRRRPVEEKFRHDGGIAEFVEFLAHDEPVTDVLRLQGSDTFTETVPLLDDQGHMTPQEVERELTVDVALRWGTGYDTELRSFVNVIATPKGGTHVSGFEAALTKTFNDAMRATKALKVNDDDVIKDDVLEGMTAVVTVRLAEPQFEGQTKEILGTPAARAVVRKVVVGRAEEVPHLHQAGREGRRPSWSWRRSPAPPRPGSRPASTRRPSAARTPWSPPRCRPSSPTAGPTDNERTELFIVEGDSALGTAKLARNSEFQALLPIRGKILNVQKASVGDMLKNAECASIIQVVGAGSGRTFDLEARALRPDHLHGRRRLRRRPHPVPAGHAVLQVHARAGRRRAGSTPPYRRCTGSSCPTPRRAWTSTSTPTPTTSCSGSWPS